MTKHTHGGRREGAGAPSKPPQKKVVRVSISLPPDLLRKLDRITTNRSKWIAEQIEQTPSL